MILVCQSVRQFIPRTELDEEQDPLVAFVVLADDQAVGHFPQLIHHVVNFRGSDPHSGRLQHAVRAAVEGDAPGIFVHDDVVAVPPDVGVNLKVGAFIFFPVRIIPEIEGHGGSRRLANQLSLLVVDRAVLFHHRP